jgi:hypothetical protein
MKLLDYETYEDYGKEHFIQVLTSRRFALLDMTVQWDEYECDDLLPSFQLSIGSSHLFGGFIRYKRFQFDCSIIDWKPRNLEWYRSNK